MALADLLRDRRSLVTRPENYEGLLLEPIMDGDEPFAEWANAHCASARFYATGMSWFLQSTGMTNKWLNFYLEDAKRFILQNTSWHQMADPRGHWKSNPAPGQIKNAAIGQPMIFAKAAQTIVTCQLALQAQIEKPNEKFNVPAGITSAEQIYGFMAIYPAVWNINGFSKEYVEAATAIYPNMRTLLLDAAAIRNSYVITDLTKGHCVTRNVANAICDYAKLHFNVPGHDLERVRAKPGRFLGSRGASTNEELALSFNGS